MASKKAWAKSKKPDPVPKSSESEKSEEEKKKIPIKSNSSKTGLNKAPDLQEEAKSKAAGNSKISKDIKAKKKPKSESDDEFSKDASDHSESGPPKRALTAYNIFCSTRRGTEKDKHPEIDNREMMGHLGKLWKKLTEAEKATFEEMAEKDKARYERQCKDYESTGRFYDENGKQVKNPKKLKKSVSKKKKPKSSGEKAKKLKKKN
ncbi:hypothetical protein SteCoe_21489 [Stentor coeruleus]|uniref:HMG box domain-containing protein n=1 Tax=Stentor coeruleus TaxID=5963 RepID=A0A1R2BPI3_9CILI|nr:hypothetical protein SteCoe_21489 [Stentor coeruleus]